MYAYRMTKRVWVDGRRAREGVLVALVGLALLIATFALRVDSDDPNCASLVSPVRAQECVAESAQALDRERLSSMLVIVVAVTVMAVGGALVVRARRRVVDIAEAAALIETDVQAIRSLIANGDLASVTSDGRTYVDAVEVERLNRASKQPERMATAGRA